MSSKASVKSGNNRKKGKTEGAGTLIMGQLLEYLLAVIVVVLCVALSLYAKDGYRKIGNAKFAAYKSVMLVGGGILLAAAAVYIVFWLRERRKARLSVTDGFVLSYLVLCGISVISGGFYEDALWGYPGWNMGLFSQVSFVLLYFFLSRFGRYWRLMIASLCGVSAAVYGIGILHRLMFDPIGFYDGLENYQKAQFLSTMGQASWYGSFLAVTLPAGMGAFLFARGQRERILAGAYTMLGFCTLVTQNSDSAYFAMAGVMIVLFMLSAADRDIFRRFMGMLTLFFGAGKLMYLLMKINPNPALEVDFVTHLMWTSWVTWALFVICLTVTVVLYAWGGQRKMEKYTELCMKWLRRIVPAGAGIVVFGIVLLIFLQTKGALPAAVSGRLAGISYFNWNDSWGNGRGRIWRFGMKLFSKADPLHKLFGVGPDCFNAYVTAHYSEEEMLLWGNKQLTNAHNEWLNMLITGGIAGATAYIGIFVTAVRRFVRGCRENACLAGIFAGIGAACVSYMCYNFFCYQQVLCTPFVFILMGIGEYILQKET